MNAPLQPEPSSFVVERETTTPHSYAPSVPISVYRELAAELKATKAMVDSLSGQNQQLTQQNQVLRQEILRFAQAADQMRQAVEPAAPEPMPLARMTQPPTASGDYAGADLPPTPPQNRMSTAVGEGVSQLAAQVTRMVNTPTRQPVKLPKQKPLPPAEKALFTEQRIEQRSRPEKVAPPRDLSGLWLSTTILLIVVSAFGAGFLIMKPLLGGNR